MTLSQRFAMLRQQRSKIAPGVGVNLQTGGAPKRKQHPQHQQQQGPPGQQGHKRKNPKKKVSVLKRLGPKPRMSALKRLGPAPKGGANKK
ncbi:hypothetical protein HK101_006650 [Irineochytrium annulatum]|nr:hypothetical protein HK101_006650 [Irineochytrium annulatum]